MRSGQPRTRPPHQDDDAASGSALAIRALVAAHASADRHTTAVQMAMNWGDVPTWVAAIGTVGTLVAALVQISSERARRLAADEQLREERHIEQARRVAAYVGEVEKPPLPHGDRNDDRGRTAFYLVNNSPEPVYSVVVGMVFLQGAVPRSLEDMLRLNHEQYGGRQGPITTVSILPSGLHRVWIAGADWHRILSGRAGAEIAFTDAAGAHWIRRASGQLGELAHPPFEYLKRWHFYGPHDLQTPARVSAT